MNKQNNDTNDSVPNATDANNNNNNNNNNITIIVIIKKITIIPIIITMSQIQNNIKNKSDMDIVKWIWCDERWQWFHNNMFEAYNDPQFSCIDHGK